MTSKIHMRVSLRPGHSFCKSLVTVTSFLALCSVQGAYAQEGVSCGSGDGTIFEGCARAKTEQGSPDLATDGFAITVNGVSTDWEGRPLLVQKNPDQALAEADIQVKFDGFGVRPRLDAGLVGEKRNYASGDLVTVQSRVNYPAWIRRGEIRVLARSGGFTPETVTVLPITTNGTVSFTLPDRDDLAFVYRVYDGKGRYDETLPSSLTDPLGDRLAATLEEGTDNTGVRGIPIRGGAVTVYGSNVAPGARVTTLGETFESSPDRKFVLQRILPDGEHQVVVEIDGPYGRQTIQRDIEIPKSEWFYVGLVDLTFGRILQDDLASATGPFERNYSSGRLAFYAKGKLANGVTVTASADTTEDELENLFSNLEEKDPRSLIDRIDPNEFYPTYGDDSTIEQDAPTSGRVYLKVEKDRSKFTFGTYKSELKETYYLNDERTLYGAQAIYRSNAVTASGQPRVELQLNAAQPETLPQRDEFLGTGGSSYFLRYQDIVLGSETLLVELRDPDTGRVLSRRELVFGQDYTFNYQQGLIILRAPLSSYADDGQLISDNPNGDVSTYLVAQYEYTPVGTNIDAYSIGARGQVWVTNELRFGASYREEDTSLSAYKAAGADLLWQFGKQSYLEFEYAETEGTIGGLSRSTDGGLIINDVPTALGKGTALRFAGELNLKDVTENGQGIIGAYYEDRTAGFSTYNHQITNDETLWGVYADFQPSDRVGLKFYYDDFESDTGEFLREGGFEFGYQQNDSLKWEFGVETLDKLDPTDPTETGQRTDAAVRLTYRANPNLSYYGFGQTTLARSGGLARNDRVGVGAEWQANDRFRLTGEISDGTSGVGAKALLNYEAGETAYYFGYTLDPDRTIDNATLIGNDSGSLVIGGRRRMSERVISFGENTYDMFGKHRSLNSTYGVTVEHSDFLTYTGAIEVGQVRDPVSGDFDRTALSFGARYATEMGLTAQARLEYRQERGTTTGSPRDADTFLISASGKYEISDSARLIGSIDAIYSDSNTATIPDAQFFEGAIGYAFRPVDNDRLNVLFKYLYLYDMNGQQLNGALLTAPKQKSHILSLDASYDVNQRWTLGGKIGVRNAESDSGGGFVENNAWLAVANARFHVVHKWDLLGELRALNSVSTGTVDYGAVLAGYRHLGNNFKFGVGYNFGRFTDDLRDLTYDDQGVFINVIAKF